MPMSGVDMHETALVENSPVRLRNIYTKKKIRKVVCVCNVPDVKLQIEFTQINTYGNESIINGAISLNTAR